MCISGEKNTLLLKTKHEVRVNVGVKSRSWSVGGVRVQFNDIMSSPDPVDAQASYMVRSWWSVDPRHVGGGRVLNTE